MLLRWVLMLLPLVGGLALVHGQAFLTGFDVAPGDDGDGRIMIFLIESGWRALQGDGSLLSPPMFFPTLGTRAYTDGHLLWLPIYGVLRLAGLDMVQAFSALFPVLASIGYIGALLLFRRALGVGDAAACAGAWFFAFCNALTVKLGHGQMIGVVVLPWITLLLHSAWQRDRPVLAALAGLLTGLLAATSYIIAWFFLFFAGVAMVLALLLNRAALRERATWRLAFGFAVGLGVGLIPFLVIYLPQITNGQRRSWPDVRSYQPVASDLLNLGVNHPVWGRLLARFGIPVVTEVIGERHMGVSPPVWLLAAGGAGVLLWRGWRQLSFGQRGMLLVAAAVALGTAAQFRYLDRWGTPWYVIWLVVPGAAAIRTTFRSEIIAMLPIGGLVAVAVDAALRRVRTGPAQAGLFAVLALLVALDTQPAIHNISAKAQRVRFAAAATPPPSCRSFALAGDVPGRVWYALQSDMMLLALHWRIPTMNGNSSWWPPGWDMLFTQRPGYAAAVQAWVTQNRLEGACLYNPSAQSFAPISAGNR